MQKNETMSAFKEISKNYNECSVRNLDRCQDVAHCCRVEKSSPEESYDCFVGFDGHGRNTFNDMLKLIDERSHRKFRCNLLRGKALLQPSRNLHSG